MSRHDPDVQDWDSLSDDERKLYARMMEVFAGFLEHTDHYLGELIQFLKDIGEYDNTLIMLVSDNGSSAEGGPTGSVNENKFFNNVPDNLEQNLKALEDIGGPKYFNHFPWGWTHAGWRAACPWPGTSFVESGRAFGDEITHDKLNALDASGWELYNLVDDPAETTDLADQEKARLIEMIGISSEGEPRPIAANGRGAQHPGHFLFPV